MSYTVSGLPRGPAPTRSAAASSRSRDGRPRYRDDYAIPANERRDGPSGLKTRSKSQGATNQPRRARPQPPMPAVPLRAYSPASSASSGSSRKWSSGSESDARSASSSATSVSGSTSPVPVKGPQYQDSATTYIWARVTAAAEALSVNVHKAWEHGLIRDDEPRTPPGQDSRLTVAMKHYYLQRANTVQDLPEWLFNDRERQVKRPSEMVEISNMSRGPPSRSLSEGDRAPHSRAAAKLHELAEAKRGAQRRPVERITPPVASARRHPSPVRATRVAGLPMGPASRKRL